MLERTWFVRRCHRPNADAKRMDHSDPPGYGHSSSPPWRIYPKTSDMINPLPSNLWVIIDENPDSVNDAA